MAHTRSESPGLALICTLIVMGVFCLDCSRKLVVVKTTRTPSGPVSQEQGLSDSVAGRHLRDGLILYRQDNHPAARREFEQTLVIDPQSWLAYYYLGLMNKNVEQFDSARRQFDLSLRYAPQDKRSRSLVYVAVGECWELQQDYGRARMKFLMAQNLHPQSAAAEAGLRRIEKMAALKSE